MSKILSKELRLETLQLYRNLLKLHQNKLNEDMRVFGDFFLKTEFNMNYKNSDDNQIKIFLSQWNDYFKYMNNIDDIKKINSTEKHLKTKMDLDQMKSFNEIKTIIEDNK